LRHRDEQDEQPEAPQSPAAFAAVTTGRKARRARSEAPGSNREQQRPTLVPSGSKCYLAGHAMFKNPELQALTRANSNFEEAVDLARQCAASATTPLDRLSARVDLAHALDRNGRHGEARSLIEDAVRDARNDFEATAEEDRAWLVEANVATSAGDSAGARRRLSRLVARLRNRPLPDDMLSRASFAYGALHEPEERDEALHWLEVSEAANPHDEAGVCRHLKTLLFRSTLEQDPDVARGLAREAVRGWEELRGLDDVDRGEALYILAQHEERQDRVTEAETACREARRIYEQAPGQWARPIVNCTLRLANLLACAARHEEALGEWNRLMPLLEPDDPFRQDVLRAIRELEEEIAKSQASQATDLAESLSRNAERGRAAIAAAREALRTAASSGRFDMVEDHATRLLGDGGTDGDAARDPAMSIRFAIELPEVLSEVRQARATARQRTGRLLEAWVDALVAAEQEKARGGLATPPDGLAREIHATLAGSPSPDPSQAYRQIEHLAGAMLLDPAQGGIVERVATALSSWAPDDPVFLFALGLAAQARGALEEAAEAYERVAALAPSALAPDVRLSRVLDATGGVGDRVVDAQTRALRKMDAFPVDEVDRTLATMSGTLVRSMFVREHVVALLGVGRAEDALQVAGEAVCEDEAFGHLACGFALARLERLEEAVGAFTRSIDVEAQKGSDELTDRAHYGRAGALALTGQVDRAIADLAVAIERNPGFAQAALEDDDFRSLREHPAFVRLATPAR